MRDPIYRYLLYLLYLLCYSGLRRGKKKFLISFLTFLNGPDHLSDPDVPSQLCLYSRITERFIANFDCNSCNPSVHYKEEDAVALIIYHTDNENRLQSVKFSPQTENLISLYLSHYCFHFRDEQVYVFV